ncbi:serine hydrolase domain-containing protein [Parapedobacter soli]|uniref:serine hydrolase domain-containing protein n=1 Tax=Parapedobacter soli TaxID=416955 RepID=UPI0021C77C88|nr:serine hydrolase domain-containing protein [Parapedobacter soli]
MKSFQLKSRLLALLALLAATLATTAQPAANVAEEIAAIMAKYDAVGTSVAVVKDNELVYNHSFGFKNLATQEPLENNDVFRIASISKSFVATSLMQLVEGGKLSLDDDVGELIGFPIRNPNYPDSIITLRMVMSHTSSISDKNGYFTLDAFNPGKNPDWATAYNDYAPGTDYQYCNLNFNLAGAILEKHSGERFDRYVRKHILEPLGLYASYNVDELDSVRFAKLYSYDPDSNRFIASPAAYRSPAASLKDYQLGYDAPIFSPTGGMKISAANLARYMTLHMNYGILGNTRILSEASARTMQTSVPAGNGYGLAITTEDNLVSGKIMKGHTGSAYGLNSAMFFQPQEKFGFVVIINGCRTSYTDDFPDIHRDLINCLYRHFVL